MKTKGAALLRAKRLVIYLDDLVDQMRRESPRTTDDPAIDAVVNAREIMAEVIEALT